MVLSSQMSRPRTSGRPNMFAKQRRRSRPGFVVFVVFLIIVAAAYWFWWRDPGSNTANGANNNPEMQQAAILDSDERTENSAAAATANSSASDLLPRGQTDLQADRTTPQPTKNSPPPSRDKQPTVSLPPLTMGAQEPRSTDSSRIENDNTMRERVSEPPTTRPKPTAERNYPASDDNFGADPTAEVQQLMGSADEFRARGQLVEARQLFSNALQHPQVGRAAPMIREELRKLNETLIFSPHIADNDPFVRRHVIVSGDRLIHLAREAKVDYRFLSRINNISDPGKIRLGQTIKIVQGPFHAVIDKSDYRLDLYLGAADELGRRLYVRSFPVGLGEFNSTPVGSWVVRRNSKAINPAWTNPRTGEHFDADNPQNPIGEYWIGLEGIDADTRAMRGYGIHGTIDPTSIGTQASMGCVRMRNPDIALIYELLTSNGSTIITQR